MRHMEKMRNISQRTGTVILRIPASSQELRNLQLVLSACIPEIIILFLLINTVNQ